MTTKPSLNGTFSPKRMARHPRSAWATRLLLLLLTLPNVVQAQFQYTNNNGTITITRYTRHDSAVTIPGTIDGLPVTRIGDGAFYGCAFCAGVRAITIPNSVTSIGAQAFSYCDNLTGIMIGNNVTSIGARAFRDCASLTAVYFKGNAPSEVGEVFVNVDSVIVYHLPGTTGWGLQFGDRNTEPWLLPYPLILNNGSSFGVQPNGFAFIVSWAKNLPVVVEASPNLTNPVWIPVATNILTGGSSPFTDPESMNHPLRFYRFRSP